MPDEPHVSKTWLVVPVLQGVPTGAVPVVMQLPPEHVKNWQESSTGGHWFVTQTQEKHTPKKNRLQSDLKKVARSKLVGPVDQGGNCTKILIVGQKTQN